MAISDLHSLAGLALLLAGWYLPRITAKTSTSGLSTLAIDLLMPCMIFTAILAASGRPLLSGFAIFALGAGWARADHDKRRVLKEPIVFTDVFQAFDIVRHPHLALPFPHKTRMALGALAVAAIFLSIFRLEPIETSIGPVVLGVGSVAFLGLAALFSTSGRGGYVKLSGDPVQDSAKCGPLATILLYGIVARKERAQRRQAMAPLPGLAPNLDTQSGPVILVQSESFFDVRRIQSGLWPDLLPNFDRCCEESMQWGQFKVPSWGANTVRTEFSVLTGLSQDMIGFDQFNPYHRLTDLPIPSLAWKLKSEGYQTICLHPFDRHFYRRHLVMPNLGFTEFMGEEEFPNATRINGFVSDLEVAKVALRLIHERGPKLFLFIITMENHGPWPGSDELESPKLNGLRLSKPERLALQRYTSCLTHADSLLGMLQTTLKEQQLPSVLAFYGDHLPGFQSIFNKMKLNTSNTDYVIWQSAGGMGNHLEIGSEDLSEAILNARRSSSTRES